MDLLSSLAVMSLSSITFEYDGRFCRREAAVRNVRYSIMPLDYLV